MIGIIGAMEEEVKALADMMSGVETATAAGMVFKKGQLKGKDVVVVRSGIGKVNAAVCTQILADRYNVDCVINTGVAGSLKNEINIGDIVISSDAIQHDMDATGFGYKMGVIPRMPVSVFEADRKLIDAARAACSEAVPEIGVFEGRVVRIPRRDLSRHLLHTVRRWREQPLHRRHILTTFHFLLYVPYPIRRMTVLPWTTANSSARQSNIPSSSWRISSREYKVIF